MYCYVAVVRHRLYPHGTVQQDAVLGDAQGLKCDRQGKRCLSGSIKTPAMQIFTSQFNNVMVGLATQFLLKHHGMYCSTVLTKTSWYDNCGVVLIDHADLYITVQKHHGRSCSVVLPS